MKPRLCIVSQYFPPEMGAPQGRLSELGERLIDRGWEVEALTALPNYPTGKLFPGYKPLEPCVETIGRIRTVRVPLMPSKGGFAKRLGSYFSYVAAASLWGPRLCTQPDLMYVESPPLFIGYAVRYLQRRWRCGYVFNVSDLWPDSAVDMGVVEANSIAVRLAKSLERSLYAHARGITGQTQDIVETIRARVRDVPVEVITNSVEPARFGKQFADAEARALVGPEPGPVFVYAGLLGLAQGLDQILDAAKALPARVPGRFVLVGDGPVREHLAQRIENERLDRVRLLPVLPRARVPALLACADVALITLGGAIHGAVPNKIYEAMASGLPILLVATGEAARRVSSADAGIVVSPNDPAALLAACERYVRDAQLRIELGANGRRAAETSYNRDIVAERLDRFLRDALITRATSRA